MPNQIDNYLEIKYRELISANIPASVEYANLYSGIHSKKLRTILMAYHAELVRLFQDMNSRLPTNENGAHYWAQQSRDLLDIVNNSFEIQATLENTSDAIRIDDYYESLFQKCRLFLSTSGGSTLPPNMEKVKMYYITPIYAPCDAIEVPSDEKITYELKLIGEGSYAKVFKYKDKFYDRAFVLKRAKNELTEKELARFRREFDVMKSLSSPYIVEVYSYRETRNEYIMEYMDDTLDSFISRNNTKLLLELRVNIVRQILRAFSYLHFKGHMHRDICPKNILVKNYEDATVIKICDFGLVKIPDSSLTTANTEFKGYFNDPVLVTDGFDSYAMCHEIYALTRIVYYVLAGKTKVDHIENDALRKFVECGMSPDKSKRFSDIEELRKSFEEIVKQLKSR